MRARRQHASVRVPLVAVVDVDVPPKIISTITTNVVDVDVDVLPFLKILLLPANAYVKRWRTSRRLRQR